MTALTVAGRALAALGVTFVLTAWALLAVCLAVVAVGVVFDIVTGGLAL